ncbi:uncharacterized protein LOC128550264 [Mercenaria mercenaria]|uniref:uncharacterized protein LOC128550264 n=1 Tax=Mercenaria mercenaria TaxID=6596 RepID=UPI00234F2645|nr:uncharacterized protein LOC128550264 [Mercenaria mercenaria]
MNQKTEVKAALNKNQSISGRVEVKYDDEWGTVCDDQFDESDAQVLCNMLGIPFGKVYTNAHEAPGYVHEPGTGNILIDDLSCLGIEKDISECRSREWGTHNCEHKEDIAITCYYKTIDPCNAAEAARLPNLEMRYVNINTQHLPKSINDSKLPFRWYNVGNNTMPVKAPPKNRCGTHLPIFSSFTTERLGANKSAEIKATQVGDNHETYDIEMKNCNDEFYVYKLKPTSNEESGYCFGIGSEEPAPTFVPDSLSTTPVTNEKGVTFMCKFNPSTKEDFYYQVKWRIEGSSQITLTKQFFKNSSLDGLRLTESDFEDNDIGLGVNISCALRAFRTPDGLPGTLSTYSKPLFFGIEVLTPYISLRKGETKSVELLNSIPIICYTEDKVFNQFIQSSCNVRLQYFSPQYGTCSSMPSFQDGCDSFLTNREVGQISRVNISVAETGQYGVAGHFKIYLSVPAVDLGYLKLWRKAYKLSVISVDVLPETHTEWRGSICTARNDPHMYTFDQRTYEHQKTVVNILCTDINFTLMLRYNTKLLRVLMKMIKPNVTVV